MYHICVPATTANLGPGFDSLGLALKIHNHFYIKEIDKGLKFSAVERDTGKPVKLGMENNLVFSVMKRVFKRFNRPLDGIELREEIEIPLARGLGSSATAVIAGILSANYILDNPLTDDEMIEIAIDIEGHPDNVVAAFKGGFIINVPADKGTEYKKVEISVDLKAVVVIPDFELKTDELRNLLPETVSYQDAIYNHSRTALLVASLYQRDYHQLAMAMQDRLHQDYRAKLIPGFYKVLEAAYKNGAYGVALSGAGPSIIALTSSKTVEIAEAMVNTFSEHGVESKYLVSIPENRGSFIEKTSI
ncbi:MAG TPA: homoserine kinase [Halanaerobiales bacterium]|nr:homoserine kinase [Halanaerobiales bacterium]